MNFLPERRADVDALRVFALLLLIFYHVLLVYSGIDQWRVTSTHNGYWADYFIALLRPWRITLVFLVGGVAARFMIERKSLGAFAWDRVAKLLTAFVVAVVFIVPWQRYVRLNETGEGPTPAFWSYLLHQAPYVDRYFGVPGPELAHAWFLPYLLLYSLIVGVAWRVAPALMRAAQRAVERAPVASLIAGFATWFAIVAAFVDAAIPPTDFVFDDISGHMRYTPVFLLGVLIGRSERFWENLLAIKWRLWAVAALLAPLNVALLWLLLHVGDGDPTLWRLVRGLYGGAMLFAILAFGSWALNRPSPALTFASDAIMPIYLLHQSVLVVAADIVVPLHWRLPVEMAALAGAALLAPVAFYLVFIRRVTVMRVLFGLRPRARAEPGREATPS